MKTNVVLIGMPGCGKSTAGVLLAKALQKDFVDTDLLLQVSTGESLQTTIRGRGIEAFHAREEAVVLGVAARNAVIATGGSVIYSKKAIAHLKTQGVVIYLHATLRALEKRLQNLKTRGVTLRPGQTLADLYAERVPLYRAAADVVLEQGGGGVEDTVALLAEAYRKEVGRNA